jgi:signal transduction histidine kinase
LKCHGEQGYKVGDIRGGVSFSIPFKPFLDAAQDQKRFLLIWHFLILLIGIIGTELAFRRILKNELLLRKALEESKVNEEKVRQLNIELEERVVQEVSKSRQKDLMLIQQSRLASMGEMIHNIAHQWRQPLNALAIIMANIQDDYKYNELSEERLAELVSKNRAILEQMSNTIDDFRDFFRSDKEAKQFDITDVIDDTLVLINASFLNNNISVEKRYTKPL